MVGVRRSFVFMVGIANGCLTVPWPAYAQIVRLPAEGSLYGRSYVAIGYEVDDVPVSRAAESWFETLSGVVLEPPQLRPEGLAFRNGLLYVAGDWHETQNQFFVFRTNYWGELTLELVIQQPFSTPPPTTSPNNEWWGPEGITFNTGATGLGADGSAIVSVEDRQAGLGATFALMNPLTGALSQLRSTPTPDDIAYGPSSHQFFLLATPNTVQVYDANMSSTGFSWFAPPGARGLTVVSAAFAQSLTGDPGLAGDIILVVCKESTTAIPPLKNRLVAYRADGTVVGAVQDISWIDAAIDNSTNSGSGTTPGPHEMEAIAVDEANGVIYIGDEAARAVYAVRRVMSQTGTAAGPVFGRIWSAQTVDVKPALPSRSAEPWFAALQPNLSEPPQLNPEGLVLHNGMLYVSGDWNETQNQVGVFSASAVGALTFSHAIPLPVSNPPPDPAGANNELWGSEGLTFNTGVTGYGAAASAIVSVEDAQFQLFGNTRALLNPTSGILSSLGDFTSAVGAASPDDIAHAPIAARFCVVADPAVMQIWTDADPPAFTGVQFPVIVRTKGATVVSPAFASFLLQDDTIAQEVILVVARSQVGSASAPNNRLAAYTLDGTLLGQQDLLWMRDALPGKPLQEFEAIAVDETNRVLYIGDEKGSAIFVLTYRLTITTNALLPAGISGQPYSQAISAANGTPPYAFSITGGALPLGLSLSTGGLLSGTSRQCGVFNFTVGVTDAAAATASKAFSLNVTRGERAGDLDGNGMTDGSDTQLFVTTLITGAQGACAADMNGDMLVNSVDVPLFVGALLN